VPALVAKRPVAGRLFLPEPSFFFILSFQFWLGLTFLARGRSLGVGFKSISIAESAVSTNGGTTLLIGIEAAIGGTAAISSAPGCGIGGCAQVESKRSGND
jgi:hypothetical protein